MKKPSNSKAARRRKAEPGRAGAKRIAAGSGRWRGLLWKVPLTLSLTLSLAAAAVLAVPKTLDGLENFRARKFERVIIRDEIRFVSNEDIRRMVGGFMDQSLISVDIDMMRRELESHPWISRASVRRQWPATLILSVSEERPIARWGDAQLLSLKGEVFSPPDIAGLEHLPRLSGPAASERQVMEQYQIFNQLLYPRGLRVAWLELNARGAWSLELANGASIKVGKSRVMEKMQRFVQFLEPDFVAQLPKVESIDLRYRNGFAMRPRANHLEQTASW